MIRGTCCCNKRSNRRFTVITRPVTCQHGGLHNDQEDDEDGADGTEDGDGGDGDEVSAFPHIQNILGTDRSYISVIRGDNIGRIYYQGTRRHSI